MLVSHESLPKGTPTVWVNHAFSEGDGALLRVEGIFFLNGKHLRTQAHCSSSGSVKAKSNSLIVWRWNVQINVHLNSSSGLTNEALVEDFNITLQHSPVSTPFFSSNVALEKWKQICYISQIIHISNNLQIAALLLCCLLYCITWYYASVFSHKLIANNNYLQNSK